MRVALVRCFSLWKWREWEGLFDCHDRCLFIFACVHVKAVLWVAFNISIAMPCMCRDKTCEWWVPCMFYSITILHISHQSVFHFFLLVFLSDGGNFIRTIDVDYMWVVTTSFNLWIWTLFPHDELWNVSNIHFSTFYLVSLVYWMKSMYVSTLCVSSIFKR